MIYIAADHAGFELKERLKREFPILEDLGAFSYEEQDDYPDFANKLALKIERGDLGILICRTGIGMSIAANRHSHIRAAVCSSPKNAKLAREHNNANILCLGAYVFRARKIVSTFLETKFSAEERHLRRLGKLRV